LRPIDFAVIAIAIGTTAARGGAIDQAAVRVSPGRVETLRSVAALAPDMVGQFREPLAFKRLDGGVVYVFDRRGHAVHTISAEGVARKLIEIGGEDGRVIEPSAFDVGADGSFAVADAPNGRERIQIFGPAGMRTGGFILPGRAEGRVILGSLVLSGVGVIAYTGRSVVMSQPESGWLISEYGLLGSPIRSVGQLRATGHENDRAVHLALNAGIPLPDAVGGGFYFVFLAGPPAFRKFDRSGKLLFERAIQGRELDELVAALPQKWPRRRVDDRELPLVVPTVRAAAVDAAGRLWVSFLVPYTYVFDAGGEKIGTIQFRAAGIVSPTSLSFSPSGRVLITPGCFEFEPPRF
jgi:hypothetical protein